MAMGEMSAARKSRFKLGMRTREEIAQWRARRVQHEDTGPAICAPLASHAQL